jgi:hypothetical protein
MNTATTVSLPHIIFGATAGLVVTIMVTVAWPRQKLRFLRPLAAAGLGLATAYALMRLL